MSLSRYAQGVAFAAASLLATAAATLPTHAAPSVTDLDAAVACQAFERWGNGAWTATAPTSLSFTNGTSLSVTPGETFATGGTTGGVEVTAVLDRHCGNL